MASTANAQASEEAHPDKGDTADPQRYSPSVLVAKAVRHSMSFLPTHHQQNQNLLCLLQTILRQTFLAVRHLPRKNRGISIATEQEKDMQSRMSQSVCPLPSIGYGVPSVRRWLDAC
jgi:hypothetical protein